MPRGEVLKDAFFCPHLKALTNTSLEVKSKQDVKMAYNFQPPMTNFCLPRPYLLRNVLLFCTVALIPQAAGFPFSIL